MELVLRQTVAVPRLRFSVPSRLTCDSYCLSGDATVVRLRFFIQRQPKLILWSTHRSGGNFLLSHCSNSSRWGSWRKWLVDLQSWYKRRLCQLTEKWQCVIFKELHMGIMKYTVLIWLHTLVGISPCCFTSTYTFWRRSETCMLEEKQQSKTSANSTRNHPVWPYSEYPRTLKTFRAKNTEHIKHCVLVFRCCAHFFGFVRQ